MYDDEQLARRFEEQRGRMHAVARRMLGSDAEADDALQEAWLRTSRASRDDVENLGAWLTTVVSRVCLNLLDARRRRREEALDEGRLPDPVVAPAEPEGEALAADAVGAALVVVLETLSPPERLAFVLHDLFGLSFEEIAPIVERSPAAARQLASRARRRVRGAEEPDGDDLERRRAVVDAFLAASREGDFAGLLAVLDPDVVLRADEGGGALRIVRGAEAVAGGASAAGRAVNALGRVPRPALVDGAPGVVVVDADGVPVTIMGFTVRDGRVVGIDIVNDAARVAALAGAA